ncbi:MAG: V-type ATPase subunit [Clostridiales bacterium]|jgi:V/A-type H+-transporting ATPase subunit C|nr:V-type ATPase subunit [Clostridiales bacterium]
MEYAALNTKIHAMHSRFLSYEDFEKLSGTKSVIEAGRHIKQLPGYAGVMRNLEGERLKRARIERSLNLSLFDDYMRLHKFVTGYKFCKFLEAFFMDNEINLIKIILGLVLGERTEDFSQEELLNEKVSAYMPNLSKLINSKTISGFMENLSGTSYYKPLMRIYNRDATIFQLEMQLDLFYYMNLWDKRKLFTGSERRAIEHIIGTQIDLRNIMWVYRFKRYYSFTPESVYAFLIPINYRLKAQDLVNLVSQKDLENQNVLNKVLISRYKNIFNEATSLESGYYQKMESVYSKTFNATGSGAVFAMHYLFLKKLEIDNITNIIESVRYGLSPQECMKHIYYPEKR